MEQKKLEQNQHATKHSFSYLQLVEIQNQKLYSSFGKIIPSTKPSAPNATIGNSTRAAQLKKFDTQAMAKIDNTGKLGLGPAAYLPPQNTLSNGQIVTKRNPDIQLRYQSTPSYSIGKSQRKGQGHPVYNYMKIKNDDLNVNNADLKRKNSAPNCRIGSEKRFNSQRKDKVTPGPTYDPIIKPQVPKAPIYSIGERRTSKRDPLLNVGCTTQLVGPSSYFQQGKRCQSAKILRIPSTSRIKNQPSVSFAKGPKSLTRYKNSVDETYDIKTKTIMAHYDFQYDHGKGLHSGKGWQKNYISTNSKIPIEKNRMKSYTIAKAGRQTQKKRGNFISMMCQIPVSIKMHHPKF